MANSLRFTVHSLSSEISNLLRLELRFRLAEAGWAHLAGALRRTALVGSCFGGPKSGAGDRRLFADVVVGATLWTWWWSSAGSDFVALQ